ncbi:hypothetical protein [Moraxella bovis]|uniref:hypothetical protein n=1 Tax=Moraxella bovis TaxID=476 RepID=UPI0022262213|nr:hypothetical protein [Moraxella bovis]UYZ79852.1 hypothetical protein LP113_07210 [Moraxella bovis]UZA09699.1 hypothetical protein LP108_04620 [Moraxella bovis]UZA34143.1 hypothetical protein LP098_07185 [Moraxella bovis]UZA46832.1 hypothetical protein LP128_06955 [Moraxella bovis]UZA64231.1 hypothetical protein LP096_03800 [Moraxella bovis]
MTYYTNDNGDVAKVIDYDRKSDTVTVVINDKAAVMAWDEFISEFKRMGVEK